MSIKSILVPISGADVDRGALEMAYMVARKFDGHVEGLTIKSVPAEILQYAHSRLEKGVYRDAVKDLEAQAARNVEQAKRIFDEFIGQKGLPVSVDPADAGHPTVSWQVAVGRESDIIGQFGGAFDLVVISRPGRESESTTTTEMLDAAIFNTGRPVLLAPGAAPSRFGRTVVIGWNRSIQSGRAVFAALPFLKQAERVVIVAITTGAKRGPSHSEIARNLAWHGVHAHVRAVAPDYRHVGEVLLDEVKTADADLLVMGAFSHSRLRERVLGGVTRQILFKADLPVLMAR